jgi:hypothetical protein
VTDTITEGDVRAALDSVLTTTSNPTVRRVMRRAVEILDSQGFEAAATDLLREIARTKKVQRELMWVNLAVAAVCAAILFAVLAAFWRSI